MHGPIDDPSGRATSILKDAISYEGAPVAFIQLIAAMDRDDEIVREIRGKRTYRIAAGRNAGRPGPYGTKAGPSSTQTVPVAAVTSDGSAVLSIDYDRLARAVLKELLTFAPAYAAETSTAEGSTAEASAPEESGLDLESLRAERDRMLAERNEYAQRLQDARAKLGDLLGEPAPGPRQDTRVEA